MKRPVTHGWGAQGPEPHPFVGSDGSRLLLYVFRPWGEVRRAVLLLDGAGRAGAIGSRFFPLARELAAAGVLVGCAGALDGLADARSAEGAFRSVVRSAGLTTFVLGGSPEGAASSLALAAEAVGRGDRVHDGLLLFSPVVPIAVFDEVVVAAEEFLVPNDGRETSAGPRPALVLGCHLQPS